MRRSYQGVAVEIEELPLASKAYRSLCVCVCVQKINHFVGMLELCRKRTLAQSIAAMAAQFPAQYQFCPQTYVLPEDLQSLLKDFKSNKKGAPKTLILKPDSGSQVRL